MKLYIAGIVHAALFIDGPIYLRMTANSKKMRSFISNRLESFYYINKDIQVNRIRKEGVKIFLDSGAFSAFSLGINVDINEYGDFVKSNSDIILMASVLDAIGDPVGTYHNQNKLESMGVEVLPCYHFGEPLSLCDYYVNNYPYITIGGMVPVPNVKLEPWLDYLWSNHLTDSYGIAKVKVHGFGMTSKRLMEKYPWYSVDSSTWVQLGKVGSILVPPSLTSLSISETSPSKKNFGKHYYSLSNEEKKIVDDVLFYYGNSVELLQKQETYMDRWIFNAFIHHEFGLSLGEDHWRKPFNDSQRILFE